ncbi:MAG: single-stranded DNA-binding protein [Faecousia sp.]
MLNHIVIMGRLTRDPELRRTSSGIAVASFTVAVDRDFGGRDGGEKETDFIDCVAWRQTGEFVSKYFTKGSMIVVSGRLQIRNWNDKDGNKRRNAEVVADNVYFGESKRSSDSNSAYGGNSSYGNSNNYGGGSYGNNSNYGGYNNAPAPAPSYGGYTAPASAPASDFAMLEDDDAQLPF